MSGRTVSLFSGYSQKENRTTNYCLLVLKMLYEQNPNYLGEVLNALCGEKIGAKVGVTFRQQQKRGESIPDGIIVQEPIEIFIEAKNYDWFSKNQLERHLAALGEDGGVKVLIALSNFESLAPDRFSYIENLAKSRKDVYFFAKTFEDFVDALSVHSLPKDIKDTISDLSAYLDEEGLLPSWKSSMDVVSCSTFTDEVLKSNVYLCPATGGHNTHRRCKYFGMYRNKTVEMVAEILAMAEVNLELDQADLIWQNDDSQDESSLCTRAKSVVREWRPDEGPIRVLLLGKLYSTNFIKDSGGGIRTKTYRDISTLNHKDARDLATILNGKTWSDVKANVRG